MNERGFILYIIPLICLPFYLRFAYLSSKEDSQDSPYLGAVLFSICPALNIATLFMIFIIYQLKKDNDYHI